MSHSIVVALLIDVTDTDEADLVRCDGSVQPKQFNGKNCLPVPLCLVGTCQDGRSLTAVQTGTSEVQKLSFGAFF